MRKDVADMTSESESVVESQNGDNDSDYLMAGLNWAHEGNYSNLPEDTQAKIKKQREKANVQGSFKYIAPLKGKKCTIEVDDYLYQRNERRKGCPVEVYNQKDKKTGKVSSKSEKCEWIFFLRSNSEEENMRNQKMMKQF